MKSMCANCKHSGEGFKYGRLTHHHCGEPSRLKEYDDPRDLLMVFSDRCEKHSTK